jgi:hypothetical protein
MTVPCISSGASVLEKLADKPISSGGLRGELFFWQFMNLFYHSVGLLEWEDKSTAKPVPTQDNTLQKDADTHPCLKWDLNL